MVKDAPPNQSALPWEQLIAKAVHDMRSPLSTMNTTLAVLRMAISDPVKAEKLLGILERQTGDLTEQLDRLLNDPESFLQDRNLAP